MAATARLEAAVAGSHSFAAASLQQSSATASQDCSCAGFRGSVLRQHVRSRAANRLCHRQPTLVDFVRKQPAIARRVEGRQAVSVTAEATVQQDTVSNVEEVPLKSDMGVNYEHLRDKLAAGEWEEADNETRQLMCVLAGEGAVKRKWVYFSEVQFIPATDIDTIDRLWKAYSNDRFGFSVQRKIWTAAKYSWKIFFEKIGWTTGERRDYRKFPMDFLWKLDSETPTGHLPLTNALRGTQLLEAVLRHPAFDYVDEEMKLTGDSLASYTSSTMPTPTPSSQSSQERTNAPLPEAYMADFNF